MKVAIAKIAGIKMIEAFNKQFNSSYMCLCHVIYSVQMIIMT